MAPSLTAIVWSDYLCPWCYVGLDRTDLLRSMGIEVSVRPYELHPEIPEHGHRLAADDGRRRAEARALYDRIEALCDEAGLPFARPPRVPNTRRVLETAEWVRQHQPECFETLHRGLFRAHFAEQRFLGDPVELAAVVAASGADAERAGRAVADGSMSAAVAESMEAAWDAGATGTPAWSIDGRLLIPGLQDRAWVERVVTRLLERS